MNFLKKIGFRSAKLFSRERVCEKGKNDDYKSLAFYYDSDGVELVGIEGNQKANTSRLGFLILGGYDSWRNGIFLYDFSVVCL